MVTFGQQLHHQRPVEDYSGRMGQPQTANDRIIVPRGTASNSAAPTDNCALIKSSSHVSRSVVLEYFLALSALRPMWRVQKLRSMRMDAACGTRSGELAEGLGPFSDIAGAA